MHTRIALAAAFAFLLSASIARAGDDEPLTPPPPPTPVAPATPPPDAPKDIIDVATANGSFKTLLSALDKAGLTDTLKGAGPFTVFAPNDAAFAKVPKKALDKLLADKAELKKVLTYHVVSGKLMAADVTKQKTLKSLEGAKLDVKAAKGKVKIDKADVITADVSASNGVIHVIDAVMFPPKK